MSYKLKKSVHVVKKAIFSVVKILKMYVVAITILNVVKILKKCTSLK